MTMLTTRLTLCLLLIGTTIFSQNKLNEKQLDKTLEALREATKTVGLSVAIVKDSVVIYSKGFGFKDLETQSKVDENTLFAIGSTTKAFTTGLLGIMEEEKGLSFTDSPRNYLPELEFYNDDLNNHVTILDMVSHRTGLPRHDFSWYLFPSQSKDSLIARIKYHEPFAGLREQWYYNNFMYLAQGVITEKLTGKSWEDNVRERYFKPLHMSNSNVTIEELKNNSNSSKGYRLKDFETNKVLPYYDIAAISPAGSINSSAKDMANWVKVWLNEGKFNGTQVLPKNYIIKAINPLMSTGVGIADDKFPDQQLNSYGYAWFTSSYRGHYRLEHGGNIDGFSANVSFFPSDKLGIVVLTNQDGSALPSLVRNAIADVLLSLKETDWIDTYNSRISKMKEQLKEQKKNEVEGKVPNTTPSHDLIAYTGSYSNLGYGTFNIQVTNDSLFAKFPREKVYLNHKHYDIFMPYTVKDHKVEMDEGSGLNFNFQTNDLGDIDGVNLKLEATLEPLVFKRTPKEAAVSQGALNGYVGTYELSGVELKVFIKTENLMLFVPGQPEYVLIPISENEFTIKGLSGYKAEFKEQDKGFNLILHQPNGTFTAVKKN